MIGGAVDLDDEPERTIHEVDTPDPGVTSEVDLAIERRLPGLFEKRAETLLETGRLIFLGTPDEFRASAMPQVRQFMDSAA